MTEQQVIKSKFKRLLSAQIIQFPAKRRKLEAPLRRGVYIIYNSSGMPVHVGCTPRAKYGLYQRLENHLQGQSSFVEKFFDGDGSKLREEYSFSYLALTSGRQIKLLEAYAIGMLCPKHIGEG